MKQDLRFFKVTSGLTLGFPSYETGSLPTCWNPHGNLR